MHRTPLCGMSLHTHDPRPDPPPLLKCPVPLFSDTPEPICLLPLLLLRLRPLPEVLQGNFPDR
eukprot:5137411-Alexandrium_andersonii.AAC.1